MASMVSRLSSLRTATARLPLSSMAVAAILLVPGMCMANELTAEQRNWYQARLGLGGSGGTPADSHPMAEAVIEWQALTRDANAPFSRVSAFVMAHPGWPQEAELRRRAEASLDNSGFVPASAVSYFERFAPTTASGHLRHALALNAAGRPADANAAARRAWVTGALTPVEESRLLGQFPGALSAADHDTRMEALLWSATAAEAARQITYVSSARRAEFDVRLAMRTRATSAAIQAAQFEAANPDVTRTNAGYIYDKGRWLSASAQAQAARALLSAPRALTAAPLDAEKWLELLLAQARGAANDGQFSIAYDIARQVDDVLPAGAAILDQPIGVRDDYTSLVWLAAQTAQNQLGRNREAAGLYAVYAGGGRSPQVQAKGLYWAGRAAHAAGEATLATDYFTRAARHFDQFHGQLALERLGQPQPRPTPPDEMRFSAAERQAFNTNSLVRAARVLGELGSWRDQTLFLRAIANNARSDTEHFFASQLSAEIGRPDLAVMVGRSARLNGLNDYVPTAFPTVRVPAGHEENWTFIHAISRQESQFDRAAISHAGARGQMQLMPGTAREVATRLGLGYDANALLTDTNYNMMLGSTYFQSMLRYYGGSYPLAVAAYNAGPGNVNRWLTRNGDPRTGSVDIIAWIEAIPLSETRGYVQRVLENAVVYESMRPGAPADQRNMLSRYLGKSTPG